MSRQTRFLSPLKAQDLPAHHPAMSFRTERQRSEESLRPHSNTWLRWRNTQFSSARLLTHLPADLHFSCTVPGIPHSAGAPFGMTLERGGRRLRCTAHYPISLSKFISGSLIRSNRFSGSHASGGRLKSSLQTSTWPGNIRTQASQGQCESRWPARSR